MGRYTLVSVALLMVFIESFYLAHVLSFFAFSITGISLIASSALFLILPTGYGLAIAVTEILGLGFWFVFETWIASALVKIQVGDILLHLSTSVTLIILWLIAGLIRQLFKQNRELQNEIMTLRKKDIQTGVLTFSEFKYRIKDIWTGLRRRNEHGYLIRVSLPLSIKFSRTAILSKVSQASLKSVRTSYDIVGILPNEEICIALQNTTYDGALIVQSRLKSEMLEVLTQQIVDLISIQCTEFDFTFSDPGNWFNHILHLGQNNDEGIQIS